jgi:serralysin
MNTLTLLVLLSLLTPSLLLAQENKQDDGTFTLTNEQVADFPVWATTNSVQLIPGDFNGDKSQDMALMLRTPGWGSIPVALSNNDGTFAVTNGPAPDFAVWASDAAVQIIPGLYNNDSCTDLALVRQAPGWGSVPVAFSNCDGTFNVTNQAVTDFPGWAADAVVKIIPGDYNKDELTDLALVRQAAGWGSIPIAFSNGDGTFQVTNQGVADFPVWAADVVVKIIEGDYNGDGQTDLALVRQAAGWTTVPVAFSNGDGTFTITNEQATEFSTWASVSSVNLIPGDFNGDGLQDLALALRSPGVLKIPIAFSLGNGKFEVENKGSISSALATIQIIPGDYDGDQRTDLALASNTAGWSDVPIAFSNANGSFTVTHQAINGFPAMLATSGVRVIGGDFNGDGKTDLSLVRQEAGWTTLPVAFKN